MTTEAMTDDVRVVADRLSEPVRQAMLNGHCSVPPNHFEYNPECVCAYPDAPELIKLGLVVSSTRWPNAGLLRSALGGAVRARLLAQETTP